MVSNSGHWKIHLSDAELQIGISAKLKQFIVSVNQKIQKVVISSKKAQRNLQEQTVHQMISEVVGSCMTLGSNPEGNHYFNYYNFLFQIGFNAKALFIHIVIELEITTNLLVFQKLIIPPDKKKYRNGENLHYKASNAI